MPQRLVAIEDLDPAKDKLLRVEWNLGRRCNFDCSYCGASTHDAVSPHIPWDVLEKTINKLCQVGKQQNKLVKLSLTGGEPFLHPDFNRFLSHAKKSGIHRISVTTNGSVHFRLYRDSLEHLHYIVVSYHLEYARRQKVLENILALKRELDEKFPNSNKSLHVHIMLLPSHFDEAQQVAQTLKTHGVHYVFRRIRPQHDENGEPLKPYTSGLLGRYLARPSREEKYYSPEELTLMKELS